MAKSNNGINEHLINIIGAGTSITGEIITEGDIRIDGKLNGDLKAKGRVVIGQPGEIKGKIECANIEIYGKVYGQINVKELTMLKASAYLEADITTQKLGVEPGAKFSGHCDMSSQHNTANAEEKQKAKSN